jgi:hypothetical protein
MDMSVKMNSLSTLFQAVPNLDLNVESLMINRNILEPVAKKNDLVCTRNFYIYFAFTHSFMKNLQRNQRCKFEVKFQNLIHGISSASSKNKHALREQLTQIINRYPDLIESEIS